MRNLLCHLINVVGLVLAFQAAPLCAEDLGSTSNLQKTFRIGMLLYRGETDAERGFRQYLQQKGVRAEYIVRDAKEDPKRLTAFVEEMRLLKPDLIYTFGTTTTIAVVGKLGERTSRPLIDDLPVVFNIVADPVGSGITQSLTGSGRNVTGVSHLVPINSQLSALRSAMNCQNIAVIYNANEKNALLSADSLESAAESYQMNVKRYPVGGSDGVTDVRHLQETLDRIIVDKPDVVYVPSDSFMIKHADKLAQWLNRARIPTMSATESPIRENGLVMGLVSPYINAGAFAGHKAYQILVERRAPGSLAISGLDKFTFLINMHTALKIGFYPKIGSLGFAEVIGRQKNHK